MKLKSLILPLLLPSSLFGNQLGVPCDAASWSRVYKPERLIVLKHCLAVRGTVVKVKCNHFDGDRKVYLKLDAEFEKYLSSANYRYQNGFLVVEIACACKLHLKRECRGYKNSVLVPEIGDYVEASGSLVEDAKHKKQTEIHPAVDIKILRRAEKRQKEK